MPLAVSVSVLLPLRPLAPARPSIRGAPPLLKNRLRAADYPSSARLSTKFASAAAEAGAATVCAQRLAGAG